MILMITYAGLRDVEVRGKRVKGSLLHLTISASHDLELLFYPPILIFPQSCFWVISLVNASSRDCGETVQQ